ncbi:MAG: phosphoribosylformylglycinamidine cyclo-ligase [candidate division WOR-3 bacterium]
MLYRDAGVDIKGMNLVKERIARMVRTTFAEYVISDIGLFGALIKVPRLIKRPILVASCDGVGTKLLIAKMMNRFDTVGIDIVNHSVNDILTLGAKPLFFLDYIAHSNLSAERIISIIKGLTVACRDNGCALVGGETAMMPDVYKPGEFDLVGFIVGIAEGNSIIDARRLEPGDVAIGLPSSGLHTNGYSLARKVFFEMHRLTVNSRLKGLKCTLGTELLRPHRSYFKKIYPLLKDIKALAHITGGGFYDNIKRILPPERSCIIKKRSWNPPVIFKYIQKLGNVPEDEMYRTFNMGIGMVVFVAPSKAPQLIRKLGRTYIIGRIVRGTFGVELI